MPDLEELRDFCRRLERTVCAHAITDVRSVLELTRSGLGTDAITDPIMRKIIYVTRQLALNGEPVTEGTVRESLIAAGTSTTVLDDLTSADDLIDMPLARACALLSDYDVRRRMVVHTEQARMASVDLDRPIRDVAGELLNDVMLDLAGSDGEARWDDTSPEEVLAAVDDASVREPLGMGPVDDLWSPVRGELTVVTGWPGSGKSLWSLFAAHLMSRCHGWHWAVWSAEHTTSQVRVMLAEFWLQKPIGKTPSGGVYANAATRDEAHRALRWVDEHFSVLDTDSMVEVRLDTLIAIFRMRYMINPFDGFMVDPWTELELPPTEGFATDMHGKMLTMARRTARALDAHAMIIAHPAKAPDVWMPTLRDVSGSAHFYNKADCGISVHRPGLAQSQDKRKQSTRKGPPVSDNAVQIHVTKIRNQVAGKIGVAHMMFAPPSRSYTWHAKERI